VKITNYIKLFTLRFLHLFYIQNLSLVLRSQTVWISIFPSKWGHKFYIKTEQPLTLRELNLLQNINSVFRCRGLTLTYAGIAGTSLCWAQIFVRVFVYLVTWFGSLVMVWSFIQWVPTDCLNKNVKYIYCIGFQGQHCDVYLPHNNGLIIPLHSIILLVFANSKEPITGRQILID
jgi:hypothetical protein